MFVSPLFLAIRGQSRQSTSPRPNISTKMPWHTKHGMPHRRNGLRCIHEIFPVRLRTSEAVAAKNTGSRNCLSFREHPAQTITSSVSVSRQFRRCNHLLERGTDHHDYSTRLGFHGPCRRVLRSRSSGPAFAQSRRSGQYGSAPTIPHSSGYC